MDAKILEAAKKVGEQLKIPVEAKKIGKQYYLYRDTTKWDKEKKKRVRVSEYLGKINENGLVEKNRQSIHEFGNSELVLGILDGITPELKKCFPDHWKDIIAMSAVRSMDPVPIRLMKSRWEKMYASQQVDAHLSPNTVSETLRIIGGDLDAQGRFFQFLARGSKHLIFDLSSLFSRSANINIAEKGYNPDHAYVKQINFALVFAREGKPVILEPMPGSVRDMKSFDFLMDQYDLKNATIIADRGLSSYELTERMKKRKIGFIVALRRNMNVIDYGIPMDGNFIYHGRGINSSRT
ncbi:transposase (IS4), partial [mine drainage metagenome]